jgi:hypothetical protein
MNRLSPVFSKTFKDFMARAAGRHWKPLINPLGIERLRSGLAIPVFSDADEQF